MNKPLNLILIIVFCLACIIILNLKYSQAFEILDEKFTGTALADNIGDTNPFTAKYLESNNGRIWLNKTVNSNDDGTFKLNYQAAYQDFYGIAGTLDYGYDVVFVLDNSGSMQNGTRTTDMISAVNSAISVLMENDNNRIGIITFALDVEVFLELGHYTTTDSNSEYLTASSSTISTASGFSGPSNSVSVSDDESIQIGFYKAAQMLINSTSSNDDILRIPIVIILSDGNPVYYSTDYQNPTVSSSTSYSSVSDYYYTILTIQYWKNKLEETYSQLYETQPYIYTIGFDLSSATSKVILNPSSTNVATCASDSSCSSLATQLTSTSNPFYTTGYDYADEAYFGTMTKSELEDIFVSLAGRNIYVPTNSLENDTNQVSNNLKNYVGYLTFTEELNEYIKINGNIVINSEEGTYTCKNNNQTFTCDTNNIIVNYDNHILTIKLSSSLINAYNPEAYDTSLEPLTISYEVGYQKDIIEGSFYISNSSTATFLPATGNTYYFPENSSYIPKTVNKTKNITGYATYITKESFDNGLMTVTFGNNGKLVLTQNIIDIQGITSVSATDININDTLTYSVNITNSGNYASKSFQVSSIVPKGLELDLTSISDATYDEETRKITWEVASLDYGNDINFSYKAKVLEENMDESTIENNFIVNEEETNSVQTTIHKAIITGNISVDKDLLDITDTIHYTINVQNNGSISSDELVVTSTLDENTIIDTSTITHNGIYDNLNNQIVWTFDLQSDELINLSYDTKLKEETADLSTIENKLNIDINNKTKTIIEEYNQNITNTLSKTILDYEFYTSRSVAKPLDTIENNIIITNTGSRESSTQLIKVTIPDDFNLVIDSINENGNYDENTKTITWELALDSYDEINLTFNLIASEDVLDLTTYPIIADLNGTTRTNNILINRSIMSNELVSDKQQATPNEEVTYKLTLTNDGSNLEENSIIKVEVPTSLILDPKSINNNGTYDEETNTITWQANIDAFSNEDYSFTAKVSEQTTDEEQIKVVYKINDYESNTVLLQVNRVVLLVEKTINNQEVSPKDIITYNIKLKNIGSGQGPVTITDALSPSLSFVSSNYESTLQDNTVNWNLSINAKEELDIELKVLVASNVSKKEKIKNTINVSYLNQTFTSNETTITITDNPPTGFATYLVGFIILLSSILIILKITRNRLYKL